MLNKHQIILILEEDKFKVKINKVKNKKKMIKIIIIKFNCCLKSINSISN